MRNWYFNESLRRWQLVDEETGEVLITLGQGQDPGPAVSADDRAAHNPRDPLPTSPPSGGGGNAVSNFINGIRGTVAQGNDTIRNAVAQGNQVLAPLAPQTGEEYATMVGGGPLGLPLMLGQRGLNALQNQDASATEQLAQQGGAGRNPMETPIPNPKASDFPRSSQQVTAEVIAQAQAQKEMQGQTANAIRGGGSKAGATGVGVGGGQGVTATGPGGRPTPDISTAISQLEVIDDFGGPLARELFFKNPEGYVQMLIDEAGGPKVNSAKAAYILAQADRLYELATLVAQSQGGIDAESSENEVRNVFKGGVTPGAAFVGSRENSLQLLSNASSQIDERAMANALDAAQGGGNAQEVYFNTAWNIASRILAPTVSQNMASASFSSGRRTLEQAKYSAAVATGKFQGTPLDWMVYRGIISLPAQVNTGPSTAIKTGEITSE